MAWIPAIRFDQDGHSHDEKYGCRELRPLFGSEEAEFIDGGVLEVGETDT